MKTMKEVAQRAGVSTATVSHVINNTRFVGREVKAKVLTAMEELHYIPNSVARSLRNQKSFIIGLLVPDISNFFFTAIAEGLEKVLSEKGYHLIISSTRENIEVEINKVKLLEGNFIDGLVIATSANNYSELFNSIKGDYPVVLIDRKPENYTGLSVLVDNEKGAFNAVDILIKRGHKRIGLITGIEGLSTSKERLKGYMEAFKYNNIPVYNNLIRAGNSKYEGGYNLTKELSKESISALFVTNNLMSIGALTALKELKLRVPEDIALIGFDDYPWTNIISPSLSVVKQPSFQIGEVAGELIIKKIKGEVIKEEEIILNTTLIIRDSI